MRSMADKSYVFDDRSEGIKDKREEMSDGSNRGTFLPFKKDKEGNLSWAVPQFMRDMWNTVSLPKDVIDGYKPTDKDIAQSALDIGTGGVSSSMMLGHAADPNTLGMFLGRRAKNADTKALSEAMSMRDRGYNRNEIWENTGWFEGKDGQWRFEVSDDNMNVPGLDRETVDNTQDFLKDQSYSKASWGERRIEDTINHEDVFSQYRDLPPAYNTHPLDRDHIRKQGNIETQVSPSVEISIKRRGEPLRGTFSGGTDQYIKSEADSSEKIRSVLLHEIQHMVQERERFEKGSSDDEVKYFTNQLLDKLPPSVYTYLTAKSERDDLVKYIKKVEAASKNPSGWQLLGEHELPKIEDLEKELSNLNEMVSSFSSHLGDRLPYVEELGRKFLGRDDFQKYQRRHGEAEARLTQTRAEKTPERNKRVHPYDDLDVPEDEVWTLKNIEDLILKIAPPEDEAVKGYEGLTSLNDQVQNFAEGGIVKDPISGNEVPPGAKPEEVRDDVPINVSEGEFIIPANVVRYIGLEKIEAMVAKAREALGDDSTGGGTEDDEPLPFEDSELSALPVEGFAEGGLVGQDTNSLPQAEGFTGTKQFKDANGRVMYIPFQNGAPLFAPPDGYTEVNTEKVTSEAPNPMANVDSGKASRPVDNDPSKNERTNGASPLAGSPTKWSVDNFIDYGKQKNDVGTKAIRGIIGVMPGGAMALKARDKFLDTQVTQLFDTMMESGVDPMGNPITPEQRTQLEQTRSGLKDQMSKQSGLNLNPIEKLTEAFTTFTNFAGGFGKPSAPAPSSGGGQPKSSLNTAGTNMVNSSGNKSDNQYSGGNVSLGSDLGKKNSGPTNSSMKSGGLYSKGGLVVRPKK